MLSSMFSELRHKNFTTYHFWFALLCMRHSAKSQTTNNLGKNINNSHRHRHQIQIPLYINWNSFKSQFLAAHKMSELSQISSQRTTDEDEIENQNKKNDNDKDELKEEEMEDEQFDIYAIIDSLQDEKCAAYCRKLMNVSQNEKSIKWLKDLAEDDMFAEWEILKIIMDNDNKFESYFQDWAQNNADLKIKSITDGAKFRGAFFAVLAEYKSPPSPPHQPAPPPPHQSAPPSQHQADGIKSMFILYSFFIHFMFLLYKFFISFVYIS